MEKKKKHSSGFASDIHGLSFVQWTVVDTSYLTHVPALEKEVHHKYTWVYLSFVRFRKLTNVYCSSI